jgi:hypothetical protein
MTVEECAVPGKAAADMHPFGGRSLSAANWPKSFADAPRKSFGRERLPQNSHRSSADTALFNGSLRVSGHVDDPNAGKLKDESTCEFRTGHTGHDDVG